MKYGETQDKKQKHLADFSLAKNRAFYISGFAILCLWLTFCWQGITTVVEIWYGNEIFNHGFFIVPGAFYLIYLKRYELLSKPIQTSALSLAVIIPALLLYVIGIAGDIQLFLHAATFTLLPALIWLLIGTQAARTILFPLVFMLFSIPVGEQLIPYLQEIAADGSVALLHLSGVPLFRSGLYIEIPQGRFLVAEACSGVSFFIASFVIGSLYAYINLSSVKRKVSFVVISLIFPVLANIVRVYGIILIAYWTDMEHAAGADHLIYGWFFFAFVIVCLLGIGELMRDAAPLENPPATVNPKFQIHRLTVALSLALFVAFGAWKINIANANHSAAITSSALLNDVEKNTCSTISWSPLVINPDDEREGSINDCRVKVYSAWFSEQDNELVSDLHRNFDPERFSLEGTETLNVSGNTFTVFNVVSLRGEKVKIVRWYEIDEHLFTSKIPAKVYQVRRALLGKESGGNLWILATLSQDAEQLRKSIASITSKNKK
ncbi:MAG: exosortase A [Pseudomonadota bacterium]|nr:exosortase A [Pseudomonadota bacterium]